MILAVVLLSLGLPEVPRQEPPAGRSSWTGEQLVGNTILTPSALGPLPGPGLRLLEGQKVLLRLPTPFPCRSAGIWWEGPAGAWRASWEAEEKSLLPLPEATDLAPETAGARGAAGPARVSGLLHSYQGPRRVIYLELTGPASISRLSLVAIAAPSATAPPPQPSALRPSLLGRGTPAGYPKPGVEPRSAWGADPPACNPGYCTVTHLAVHHTANANEFLSPGYAQCALNVKAIQSYHLYTRGWCDIGYQYLICVHGRIWEGRAGDDIIGAHDRYNCGSMATAFMGYFHPPYSQQPTPAMLDAMAELGAWKCDQRGIDPLGSSWYAGYGGVMENLYGHRDVGSTSCPGDLLYAELPWLRSTIDGLLNGGGWSLVMDNPQASFSGSWFTGTSSPDKYGPDYRWASTGTAPARAWWTPPLPQAGSYEISMWWPAGSNRNPATRVGLILNGQLYSTTVDQRIQGGRWNILGSAWLPAGAGTPIGLSNEGAAGAVVIADAIRLVLR